MGCRSNLAQKIIPNLLTSVQGVDLGSRDIYFPKQGEGRACHPPQHSPSSGRPEDESLGVASVVEGQVGQGARLVSRSYTRYSWEDGRAGLRWVLKLPLEGLPLLYFKETSVGSGNMSSQYSCGLCKYLEL